MPQSTFRWIVLTLWAMIAFCDGGPGSSVWGQQLGAGGAGVQVEAARPGGPSSASPGVIPRGSSDAVSSIVTRETPLRFIDVVRFEQSIRQMFSGRVTVEPQSAAGPRRMFVEAGTGKRAALVASADGRQMTIEAPYPLAVAWERLIQLMDQPATDATLKTDLVLAALERPVSARKALHLIQSRTQLSRPLPQTSDIVTWDLREPQPKNGSPRWLAQATPQPPSAQPPAQLPADATVVAGEPTADGLLGPVQIEYLDGLDVIVLRGKKEDVDRVNAIIREIEQLTTVTEPAIEIVDLRNVDGQAMVELIQPLYTDVLSVRQGRVSITALVKPNSILLVGRPESVKVVVDLIEKLDRPVAPDTQFHVYRLRHMSVVDAEQTVTNFYEERGGLGTRVRVVADFRSNALIVQASPRDAREIRELLGQVDVASGEAVNEVRVFRLKNSLAQDLAPVLEQALRGAPGTGTQNLGGFNALGGAGQGQQQQSPRATTLSLATIDAQGKRLYESGVLADVQITADTQANAIVVRGPEESMALIEALIGQLDALPTEDAEIKVFTIVNGDASLLATVLQQLFGTTQVGGFQQAATQGTPAGINPLLPLRFSVDERTNSIVASGSRADLRVVEAILLRLDEEDTKERENGVFRLRYAPAPDVATAINTFLDNQRNLQQLAPAAVSPFQQVEREVIVVAEPVSNSLIVSATPRYFTDILRVIRDLDARPPMVMIQVLIAQVDLQSFFEKGIELGIQDPLLFDRSVLTDVITPGFNFNNLALGNANNAASLATRDTLGGQGLSSFGVGRSNSEVGFGGLVLSASSDAISLLIRALEQDRHLQVLSRPQIMTLDNQPAFVQVGQRVPRITSSQNTINGIINNTVLENVGLILGVTPRISPDGLVVMEIDAENSKLAPEDEGIPISINLNGDVIRSPIIDVITAQTTVSARSGQTVVIGGLIAEEELTLKRGVPFISGIPVLRDLFRYDRIETQRSELLFVLTPYILREDQDANCINQMEAERMSWCLSDVYRLHGYFDLQGCEGFSDGTPLPGEGAACEMVTIYPDQNPSGELPPGEAMGGLQAPNWEKLPAVPPSAAGQ